MCLQGPGGHAVCGVGDLLPQPPPQPCWLMPSMLPALPEQTYCDRLVQDTPFLMGHGSLSEQQVDRIILQLNRYYPQILSNKDAEKVMGRGWHVSRGSLPPGLGGSRVGGRTGQLRGESPAPRSDVGPRTLVLRASVSSYVIGACWQPSRDARSTPGDKTVCPHA